jgi:hypothetical protein
VQLVRWVGSENVPTVRRAEVATVYREGAGRLPPREYAQVDFDIVGPAESVEGRALADAELLKVSTHMTTHSFVQSSGTAPPHNATRAQHTRPRPHVGSKLAKASLDRTRPALTLSLSNIDRCTMYRFTYLHLEACQN